MKRRSQNNWTGSHPKTWWVYYVARISPPIWPSRWVVDELIKYRVLVRWGGSSTSHKFRFYPGWSKEPLVELIQACSTEDKLKGRNFASSLRDRLQTQEPPGGVKSG